MRLRRFSRRLSLDLCIILRAYLEKPRTNLGWKGLINDPDLNETYQINKGIRISRQLYASLAGVDVPLAGEMLDTISPQFLSDLISMGAIGARTAESQLHREIASGLPFPVGFKNATDGGVDVAINSLSSAKAQHHFISLSKPGLASIVHTGGNDDCFVVLRGGTKGTNFGPKSVSAVHEMLRRKGQREVVMIDCSHGNSEKDFRKQANVAQIVGDQLQTGERGIVGVMIESNIHEGRQEIPANGIAGLKEGVSITDGCIGWETTVAVLEQLAESVRVRRKIISSAPELPN